MFSVKGLKRYAKNTGYLFLEKIARTLMAMIVWAQVGRYLGPEHFGIFNYALSFVFLFKVLSDLGLNDVVVQELVKREEKRDMILGTTFFMRLVGSVVAIYLIYIATDMLTVDFFTRIVVLMMSFRLFFQVFNNIDFYFQSRVLAKYVVYAQLGSLFFSALLCLTFIRFKMPLLYFVYVILIEACITSLGLIILYWHTGEHIAKWRFNFAICKGLLKAVWPIIISGIAISIYMRIDQIMINEMLDTVSVGYYSAAVRVSEAFYFLPLVVTSSLFPAIVSSKIKDEAVYKKRLQALLAILVWPAIGVSLLFTVFAKPIILLLYGRHYVPAIPILTIHIWATAFVFLGVMRSKWAINENLQFYTMVYVILGAIVNVCLNIVLIPAFGLQGAAWATVIAQAIAGVFSNLLSAKTRSIFFLQVSAFNPTHIFQAIKSLKNGN